MLRRRIRILGRVWVFVGLRLLGQLRAVHELLLRRIRKLLFADVRHVVLRRRMVSGLLVGPRSSALLGHADDLRRLLPLYYLRFLQSRILRGIRNELRTCSRLLLELLELHCELRAVRVVPAFVLVVFILFGLLRTASANASVVRAAADVSSGSFLRMHGRLWQR
jgi:hypothetical protein